MLKFLQKQTNNLIVMCFSFKILNKATEEKPKGVINPLIVFLIGICIQFQQL